MPMHAPERRPLLARLLVVLREPLAVSLALSLTLFVPLLCAADRSFDLLPGSVFDASVRAIENTIVMYSTLSLTFPLIIDMTLDLFSFKQSDISFLGYRFLSILNVVVVTSVSLAFQSAVNAPSVAITAFCWGFYLEFCVISSFLHYLIPQYFSFRHVVVLNFLLYPTALLPIVYSIASSPHDFFRGLFFSTFYLYGGCFAFLAGLWLLSLRRAYLASRLTLRQYAGSLSNNDVCILSLLAGLAITSLTLLVVFHALIPAFPFIGHTSNAMHLLVDISRSCLCIFTYIIPYRMFRERLIEARRDLEIKTEFVKFISHEMRTPVGAILVGLEDLMDSQLAQGRVPDLDVLRREFAELHGTANIALEILDDLLLYEKLERGSLEMNLSLQEPVAALTKVFRFLPQSIRMLPQIGGPSDERFLIQVDRQKLLMAINAIISHGSADRSNDSGSSDADDAMPKLTAQLQVRPCARASEQQRRSSFQLLAPAPRSVFSVVLCDYRNPAPREAHYRNLSQDAMKFERVSHDDGRGSGFGLWIAKRFIGLHGATVSAGLTEDGAGMRVQLDFPLFSDEGEGGEHLSEDASVRPLRLKPAAKRASTHAPRVAPEALPEATEPAAPPPPERPLRVLVVDDSAMVRRVTVNLLKSLGHSWEEAADGLEAVEAVRRSVLPEGRAFDLILMDQEMPRATGCEATAIIRGERLFQGLILGVTGNSLDEDVRKFLASGASNVIIKPMTKEKFLEHTLSLALSPEPPRPSLQTAVAGVAGAGPDGAVVAKKERASVVRVSGIDVGINCSMLVPFPHDLILDELSHSSNEEEQRLRRGGAETDGGRGL